MANKSFIVDIPSHPQFKAVGRHATLCNDCGKEIKASNQDSVSLYMKKPNTSDDQPSYRESHDFCSTSCVASFLDKLTDNKKKK